MRSFVLKILGLVLGVFCSATIIPFLYAAVLFEETFNRTSGMGPDWSVQVGRFTTDGNNALSSGPENWAAVVPAVGTDDYLVESTLLIPAGALYSGIVARGNPSSAFYQNLYAAQIASNGTVNLYRRNASAWTLLKGVSAGIVANRAYTVGLKVTGSSPVLLEVLLDGNLLYTFEDSSPSRIASGLPGIQNYNSNVKYDQFKVYAAGQIFPTARITASPTSGAPPLTVHFDGEASTDPDGVIVRYAWDFGDGTIGTGKTIDHTYSAAGTYSVQLTVTDNAGTTGTAKTSIVVGSPSAAVPRYAYAANSVSNDVTMYTVDAATGALAKIGSIAAESEPYTVAVDPKGRFVYAGNFASNTVSMYRIDSKNGLLTGIGSVATGVGPYAIAIDPAGTFAYVVDENASIGLWIYRINQTTGQLTSIGTVDTGISPISIAMAPSGKFVYVANTSSNDISMYSRDETTGLLTRLGEVPAGKGTNAVVVHPSGRFAYAAHYNSNDVWSYTIDAAGRLTRSGTIPAGVQAFSMAVDPSGRFAYVANSATNDISMYRIDSQNGTLASLGAIAGGSAPRNVTVDPSGRFVYVANLNSNDISVYSINADGSLTTVGRFPAGTRTRSIVVTGAADQVPQ